MKTLLAIFAIIITAAQSFADITPPVRWDIETGRLEPRPFTLSIRRGESLKIEPRFLSYDAPINLSGAAVEMRYATSYNMATHYSATGSVQSTTGRVQIAWSDSLNPTNNSMYYEIRATSGTQILARAYGPLRFLGGMVGLNTGLVARTSLDWATVAQVNGTAVLSNQMGSGATWTGSNWTFAAGSGISAATATGIVTGIAYPLTSNPSNYCTIFAATNGLSGYVLTNDARLTDARAWTGAANLGTAAYASSNQFATSNQGARADAALTNESDTLQSVAARGGFAGTETISPDSIFLTGSAGSIYLPIRVSGPALATRLYLGLDSSVGYMPALASELNSIPTFWRFRNLGDTNVYVASTAELAGYYPLASGQAASNLAAAAATPAMATSAAQAVVAPWTNQVTASSIAAAGGVTNGGATVNGSPITNGAAITIAAGGGIWTPVSLLPYVADTTCTLTRAMVATNAAWSIIPTGTVFFAADSTLTDTNIAAVWSLDIFYNAQTFGFVGASVTNTKTLTSNVFNSIVFDKGSGSTQFTGR